VRVLRPKTFATIHAVTRVASACGLESCK
jgi:hypothetical protein